MTITFRDTQNTAPMTWSDPSVIESQRSSTQVASWDRLENGDHAEHGKPVRPYRYSTATATSSWKEPSIGDNALHRPLRPAIHVVSRIDDRTYPPITLYKVAGPIYVLVQH